jgi:hypothetical protein
MRLSEAIALGRTLCISTPYAQDDGAGGGCALGMGARAMNRKFLGSFSIAPDPVLHVPCDFPCKCKDTRMGYFDGKLGGGIAHIFNEHVHGDKSWTLDQLIDWVRSVEPAEAPPSLTEAVAIEAATSEVVEKPCAKPISR